MPHRIHLISETEFRDVLDNYGEADFILDFEDAAEILRMWRNPHLGRSSREGAVISMASKNAVAIDNIIQRIMTTPMGKSEEERLISELKLLRFIGDRILPGVLEKVNLNELTSVEDIVKYIQKLLKELQFEGSVDLNRLAEKLEQLKEIVDIEIHDQFGRKKRIPRENVMELLGQILGGYLAKQISVSPIDEVQKRPSGALRLKETYKSAVLASKHIPPTEINRKDIVRVKKDRTSLIYFIVDLSQSMKKEVFEGGMSRLDGALLTALSLYYYYRTLNRRKRKRYDLFKLAVVPVQKQQTVIDNETKMEHLLLSAEAKGKTHLVQSINTAIEHARSQYKDKNIDVQFVILTDGMPNVPTIPFKHKTSMQLKTYFEEIQTKTNYDTIECMLQLNAIFRSLKNDKTRKWNINYFLLGTEAVRKKEIYVHTAQMLKGVTRPILVDPAQINKLGAQILQVVK